jgi:DNA polymerase
MWKEMENACSLAVQNPGSVFVYRQARFVVRTVHGTPFLAMRLPSGRCLWYCRPRMEYKSMPWGEQKLVVAYDGVDSMTRKFGTQYLYGGLLTENLTQATARDLLVHGMLNAESHGYSVVMHVHDEAVVEVPEGRGDVEEFENLLCELPSWAEGLPLKAEGWRGKRYKK